ncbi:hypothetical protein [Methylobacterium sp. WL120]|uniref:hypothetical protein n=1 Tax=Methylobacterium sp. WL120 TaxID=2603887 RepID=UPI0011CAF8C9|nr:hypothetical protein [Methylobacterium sp. WL120]TXM69613.1 hypothetical protein FV229_04525 [Methylobacterium sp. WL120]
MSVWNKITEGLVKAMVMVAGQSNREEKRRKERPRYHYMPFGTAVHGKRSVGPELRAKIDGLIERINLETDKDEREKLVTDLRKLPVNFVPVKRAELVDYGRYGALEMKAFSKAGGGAKELARAAKRRAARHIEAAQPALAA